MKSREVIDLWEESNLPPFDAMIISWNGARPQVGEVLIEVSVQNGPFFPYMIWGSESQKSDQLDVLEIKKGASSFAIRVSHPLRIHVYMRPVKRFIELSVPGVSQRLLDHPRTLDLCSPACLTAVVNFLTGKQIDAAALAERVKDQKFDIFGNWVLNVAEASHQLGPSWNVWVEALPDFGAIYAKLIKGLPVIVSVRGPLPGGALPYAGGHLIVVRGFDPLTNEVLCMDPAFEDHPHVRYKMGDFLAAWERRDRIGYLFDTNEENALS